MTKLRLWEKPTPHPWRYAMLCPTTIFRTVGLYPPMFFKLQGRLYHQVENRWMHIWGAWGWKRGNHFAADHVEPRKFLTKGRGALTVNIPGTLSSTKSSTFLVFLCGEHRTFSELEVIRAHSHGISQMKDYLWEAANGSPNSCQTAGWISGSFLRLLRKF